MRYLLISLFIFSLVSCASLPTIKGLEEFKSTKTIENPYFSNKETDYVYKAKIQVNGNNLGGLLIVKKINKNHHRVVFTTEFGNKIFDFEFDNLNFKVNSIMDKLNKKIVINALKKDFGLLVNQYNTSVTKFNTNDFNIYKSNLNKKVNYYFFDKKKNTLNKIIMTSKRKEKVSISFENISNKLAKKINIEHHNFNMNINLNYIN